MLVVTGGTKGIGRSILERFAAAGFDVCTCSRSDKDLEKAAKELTAKHGVKVFYRAADMSRKEQVKEFVEFVKATGRQVDVLVNNSGHFIPGQVLDESEGTLESMIESNLYSAYHVTRGLAPKMREARSGHIFNIGSIASIKAYPNGGSYAISKFALRGFSMVLREELKDHGVRVTSVLAGATLTTSWAGTDLPDERFMSTEDIAEAIWSVYSLSPRSVVEEILVRPQLGDI